MFIEDIIAGALLVAAAFFLVLSLASYSRSRVPGLLAAAAIFLTILLKNAMVVLDALYGTLGGALVGYYHFIIDAICALALLLMRPGRGGG